MTLEELLAELTGARIRPAYLVAGEEALLRDDAVAALRRAVLDGAPEDFNLDRLDGASATPADLGDAIGALPLMASRRLVLLRDPDVRRAGGAGLLDAVAEVVASLRDGGDAVLVVVAARPDGRSRWVKCFRDPAAVVRCEAPSRASELKAFVVAEAKRQGVTLGAGAAELLAERVGPQLMLLRQEIAKAALLAGADPKVTRAHIEASTAQVAEQRIWDLTDAIGEGRTADAVELLSRMQDAQPPMVLGALAAHFRRLIKVNAGDRGGGPPFVVRKLEAQARRLSSARLLAGLRAIHETDTAIKGGGALPAPMAIERLVLALAS